MIEGISSTSVEHKRLGDELDDIFSETLHGMNNLRSWLKPYNHKGNAREVFNRFFVPFSDLYIYTRSMKDLEGKEKLLGEIKEWIEYPTGEDLEIYTKYMYAGIKLFEEYSEVLISKNIIVMTRV